MKARLWTLSQFYGIMLLLHSQFLQLTFDDLEHHPASKSWFKFLKWSTHTFRKAGWYQNQDILDWLLWNTALTNWSLKCCRDKLSKLSCLLFILRQIAPCTFIWQIYLHISDKYIFVWNIQIDRRGSISRSAVESQKLLLWSN